MKVYIVSLKYAPGLYKEFSLLGDKIESKGIKTHYIISESYPIERGENYFYTPPNHSTKQVFKDIVKTAFRIIEIINQVRPQKKDLFLIYNPHPLNPFLQLVATKLKPSQSVLFLHEPYKSINDRRKYGLAGLFFFSVVSTVQNLSIKLCKHVVTMSPYGSSIFRKNQLKHTKKLLPANILIPNKKIEKKDNIHERKYFSFIGTVNKGKNITDIINIVNYCTKKDIHIHKFLIITKSNIDIQLSNLLQGWEKTLTIINKEEISDGEIERIIAKSYATLILHKTASQSGVLPVSYKYGTPVIARDLKAFTQYIDHSGVVLPYNFSTCDFLNSCQLIKENFHAFSQKSKNIYYNNFHERNFEKYYGHIFTI